MALELDIASNTRKFMSGVDDVEGALEGVSDALDDLTASTTRSSERAGDALSQGIEGGARDAADSLDRVSEGVDGLATDVRREADRAGDNLGDGIRDGTRDADRALEGLERSFGELQATARRETSTVGTDIGRSVREGTDEASAGMSEFGDEANSTAKETAASFDGSAESIVGSFQEIAANALGGFGPLGAAAGLALAAGIGLAQAGFTKNQEASAELKQEIADLVEEYIDAGSTGERSMSGIADAVRAMATATEDGQTSLGDLRELADKTGEPFADIALAIAGDRDALDKLTASTKSHIDALDEQSTAADDGAGGLNRAATAGERQRDALLDLTGRLDEARAAQEEATAATELFALADDGLARKAEAAQQYSEAVQGAYAEAGGAIDEFVVDGVFNLDAYNAAMEASAEAINNYQQNVVTASSKLSTDALAYIESLGPDSAPALQAFIDAPLDQQQRTAANWDAIGKTSTSAFSNRLTTDLSSAQYTSTVKMYPDMTAVNAELQKTRSISILARISNARDLPGASNPARQGMGVP